MRVTLQLLASVQRGGAQYLEAGAPTGITGLLTHASPRTTLLYTYSSTLEKLKKLPESSVYRQSTEALTKHRMDIIASVKPAGLQEWQQRIQPIVDANPGAFRKIPASSASGEKGFDVVWKDHAGEQRVKTEEELDEDAIREQEENVSTGGQEAAKFAEQNAETRKFRARLLYGSDQHAQEDREQQDGVIVAENPITERVRIPRIEPEPALTAEQINELEGKIGAGLIEEVIQVAEGEMQLVDTLAENQV